LRRSIIAHKSQVLGEAMQLGVNMELAVYDVGCSLLGDLLGHEAVKRPVGQLLSMEMEKRSS
jgi:hypothetical protein